MSAISKLLQTVVEIRVAEGAPEVTYSDNEGVTLSDRRGVFVAKLYEWVC
jgi:hypothetical protein